MSGARPLGRWLDLVDVAGLRALWTVNDFELDRLAFLERAEAVALDSRVVDEHVTASVALDESVTLGVVEPLDLACDAHRSCSYVLGRQRAAASLNQPRQPLPEAKKKAALCGLSLSAPGLPGVG